MADIAGLVNRLEDTVLKSSVIVSFKGAGHKLDTTDDIRVICQALEDNPGVNVFCLQGNTLGSEAAKSLKETLKRCDKLERLLCDDIFTGRTKTDIPLSLEYLSDGMMLSGCRLISLDFSGNAFGELAIESLYRLLTSETCYSLKELRLNNTGLGPGGGKLLAKALLECLEKSNDSFLLRVFVCGRSRLENEGAKALAKFFERSPDLEELVIPQNGIFHDGIQAVAEALVSCTQLRRLNVNDNILSPEGAESLRGCLAKLTRLDVLDVGDCVLKSEGALHIVKAIQGLEDLREVYLGHNEIEIEAGLAIVDTMANKPNLQVLELDGNKFGDEGIREIEERMDALGKIDALCAFSEDEGRGDEEDYEDYKEEPFSFEDFALSPTLESLLQLENPGESAKAYLDNFQCLDHTALLRLLVKIGGACDGSQAAIEAAVECCHPVMEQMFALKFDQFVLLNQIATHLGFVKDETRTVKTPQDLSGCLLVIAHFKEFFPREMRSMMKTFVENMAPRKCAEECLPQVIEAYTDWVE